MVGGGYTEFMVRVKNMEGLPTTPPFHSWECVIAAVHDSQAVESAEVPKNRGMNA
jgi:hypothetical protein